MCHSQVPVPDLNMYARVVAVQGAAGTRYIKSSVRGTRNYDTLSKQSNIQAVILSDATFC